MFMHVEQIDDRDTVVYNKIAKCMKEGFRVKKIYSAFISSAFESLRDERKEVINALLDFRVLPIGMEHFTVSTNGEFSDIQELIDDSDFFIMLLGGRYGSCDKEGISWTEREYIYAVQKEKPIIVIACDEFVELLEKDSLELSEDQRKQVEFRNRITGYVQVATTELSIEKIINQFFHTYTFSKSIGWTRIENIDMHEKKLEEWKENHKVFDISGIWHHIHLSEDDEDYIRVGNIKIEQDFHPDRYKQLHMDGYNYSVLYYDSQENVLYENKMKNSSFSGEYTLQENGEIFGIFNSKRTFKSEFNSLEVNKGTRRGIHDFTIDVSKIDVEILVFDGEFHDEAPSPKQGRIFLFRDIEERNKFLLDNRKHIIEVR